MKKSIVVLLFLTGCSFFSKSKSTFYSLQTTPGTVSAKTGSPISIEGIELPPGIDRREIAVRGADLKLELRPNQQWAGPLEDMVIHTLAFDLAGRMPEGMVVLPGTAKPVGMRPVFVVFEELAATSNREFVLDARWTLAGKTTHERIAVPMGSTDSAEIVKAMSGALGTLADRLAAAF